ncbi:MAG: hypothetical protein JWR61_2671 [Ferruginibacter sp.]|uniref:porin family protein n=1 Tax=Ferruginibacter sp. TaxID=1940288 RepID=UPI0026593AB0|nr:porin family protein [Ferruginibacter sp.]MDB5277716.1 hypothetical protein [Ferruginibacter sp.]
MNLRGCLVLTFTAIYFTATAQKKQYGLTASLNVSNVTGNGMAAKYQSGFEAGAFALIPVAKKLTLQPELLFNLLKVSRSNSFPVYYVDNNNPSSSRDFNLAYLSIPILLNYPLSAKITINAGPQYNLLVYSNEALLYNKKAFKNNDAGVRAGMQFHPSPDVSLFASYYYGITNINDIDNRYQWKNRQFQVGVNVAVFGVK